MKACRLPIAPTLGRSRHFRSLCRQYAVVPSAVLMRTPETELMSALPMEEPVLDLCCGDGYFGSLLSPEGMRAGCDQSLQALEQALSRGQYEVVACADVTRGIPFRDEAFRAVISNSSLEHVTDLEMTLREIARVLQKGGKLYTTLASSYAYQWWPCGNRALTRYLEFQPVHNYPTLEVWATEMEKAGLRIVEHYYYLSRCSTRLMLFLDYHFSHAWLTTDRTLARPAIGFMRLLPRSILAWFWQHAFGGIRIGAGERGGGILIVAERPGQ